MKITRAVAVLLTLAAVGGCESTGTRPEKAGSMAAGVTGGSAGGAAGGAGGGAGGGVTSAPTTTTAPAVKTPAVVAGTTPVARPIDRPMAGGSARPVAAAAVMEGPTTQPGGAVGVTPEMLTAIRELSAQSFQARQDAVDKLQSAMARQCEQMILMQEMLMRMQQGLANQMEQMTMAPEPETHARMASLLEFQSGLARWAADMLTMPEEQRQKLLAWGLSREGVPLVGRAYSRKEEMRIQVARTLAKMDGEGPQWLLTGLLNDPDRGVSLATLDAIWDRPPTPEIVDALWNWVAAYPMQQIQPRPQRQRNVTVHGRMVTIYDQDYSLNNRMQDADIAVDLLIAMKSPLVNQKFKKMFEELAASARNGNDYRWRVLSENYGGSSVRPFQRLMEGYKPKELPPLLMKLMDGPQNDGYTNNINGTQYRYSSRIDLIALMCRLTNQAPEDYKMKKLPNYGDRWMLQGAEKEEEESIREMKVWWSEHYKEYGAEAPPKLPKEIKEKKVEEKIPEGVPVPAQNGVDDESGRVNNKEFKEAPPPARVQKKPMPILRSGPAAAADVKPPVETAEAKAAKDKAMAEAAAAEAAKENAAAAERAKVEDDAARQAQEGERVRVVRQAVGIQASSRPFTKTGGGPLQLSPAATQPATAPATAPATRPAAKAGELKIEGVEVLVLPSPAEPAGMGENIGPVSVPVEGPVQVVPAAQRGGFDLDGW